MKKTVILTILSLIAAINVQASPWLSWKEDLPTTFKKTVKEVSGKEPISDGYNLEASKGGYSMKFTPFDNSIHLRTDNTVSLEETADFIAQVGKEFDESTHWRFADKISSQHMIKCGLDTTSRKDQEKCIGKFVEAFYRVLNNQNS